MSDELYCVHELQGMLLRYQLFPDLSVELM